MQNEFVPGIRQQDTDLDISSVSVESLTYSVSKEHLNHHLGAFDFHYSSPKMDAAVAFGQ